METQVARLEVKSDSHERSLVELWTAFGDIRKLVNDIRVQVAAIVGAFGVLQTIITAVIVSRG